MRSRYRGRRCGNRCTAGDHQACGDHRRPGTGLDQRYQCVFAVRHAADRRADGRRSFRSADACRNQPGLRVVPEPLCPKVQAIHGTERQSLHESTSDRPVPPVDENGPHAAVPTVTRPRLLLAKPFYKTVQQPHRDHAAPVPAVPTPHGRLMGRSPPCGTAGGARPEKVSHSGVPLQLCYHEVFRMAINPTERQCING